jgi:hypothetical protein
VGFDLAPAYPIDSSFAAGCIASMFAPLSFARFVFSHLFNPITTLLSLLMANKTPTGADVC